MHRSLVLALSLVFSAACGGAAPQQPQDGAQLASCADLAPAVPPRPSPQRPSPEQPPHFDIPDGGGDGG